MLDTCWVAQLVAEERCFGLVDSYIAHNNDIPATAILTTLLDPKIHDLTTRKLQIVVMMLRSFFCPIKPRMLTGSPGSHEGGDRCYVWVDFWR